MKRNIRRLLFLTGLCLLIFPITVFAEGSGNVDGGGGGMGGGNSQNKWIPGQEGVRVTVIRVADRLPVTTPVDFSNNVPAIQVHFGKVSKVSYNSGQGLAPTTSAYSYTNPSIPLPVIIDSDRGTPNIDEIKRYFCSEYMIQMLAQRTGMRYRSLINGDYKILLEPIAYVTFEGVRTAFTATEAGLYDQATGTLLQRRMPSLSHKNLPLAMFLEIPDMGYPAWGGTTSGRVTDDEIIWQLGLGIVRFKNNVDPPPQVTGSDYIYRTNTDVITAVTVRGGQADPDRPVSVQFNISGQIYTVDHVYYPEGESQLVWVKWRTPDTPQTAHISVSASAGTQVGQATITAKIEALSDNPPPNPVATDRNDSFRPGTVPNQAGTASTEWGVWTPSWKESWAWADGWLDVGNWEYQHNTYRASLLPNMKISPDGKVPTADGNNMKSGYGIRETISAKVDTNQSTAVTGAQNAVTYFPEFKYKDYWRLLDLTQGGLDAQFQFKNNKYSTYDGRTHFTPVWYPDGAYQAYTWLLDVWTPKGMLSANLNDTVVIHGSLWDDWHIAPLK